MNETAPRPLVPAEVDLRDFQFMPVDVSRVLKSETWVLGTGDEKAAAMTLWLESWQQVPAGSLPDSDRMLARLSQCDRWTKARAHALRGWVLCSDRRLYHPVVCEKVLEAWIEKLSNSLSGAAGNAKRWGVAIDQTAIRAQFITAVEMLRAIAPQSRALKKKVVAVILAGSPPDTPPESPPDGNATSPPDSGPDRKGQRRDREGIRNTPISPQGGKRSAAVGLKAWLDDVKGRSEKPVPEGDAVFAYADEVGIPRDFLRLAWLEFRHRYTQPEAKRYRDWRAVFRKAVRGNWLKLWYVDSDGSYGLTTVGVQAKRAHDGRAAA